MTYQEAIEYLYAATPVFQQVGTAAYKPGLETTHTLDTHYGHPHRCYRTIHVGGARGGGAPPPTEPPASPAPRSGGGGSSHPPTS